MEYTSIPGTKYLVHSRYLARIFLRRVPVLTLGAILRSWRLIISCRRSAYQPFCSPSRSNSPTRHIRTPYSCPLPDHSQAKIGQRFLDINQSIPRLTQRQGDRLLLISLLSVGLKIEHVWKPLRFIIVVSPTAGHSVGICLYPRASPIRTQQALPPAFKDLKFLGFFF